MFVKVNLGITKNSRVWKWIFYLRFAITLNSIIKLLMFCVDVKDILNINRCNLGILAKFAHWPLTIMAS